MTCSWFAEKNMQIHKPPKIAVTVIALVALSLLITGCQPSERDSATEIQHMSLTSTSVSTNDVRRNRLQSDDSSVSSKETILILQAL